MDVLGYADRLSVRAGERITFFVSCEVERFRAEVVRFNRAWPVDDLRQQPCEPIASEIEREYAGKAQPVFSGSYVEVPAPNVELSDGVTVHLWFCPTLPERGREQGIVSRGEAACGFNLLLAADGRLVWRTSGGAVASSEPLIR